MSTSTPLIFTNRLYKYIKSSAIVGIIQAGVELVTNADDAYKKSDLEPPHKINAIVDYHNKCLLVWDQAIGLTGDEMINSFGQVGDYTSNMLARGYFSRGAKDITAIGHATFVGIKDNKLSEVQISTDDMFTIIKKDIDVTSEHRELYNITNNGLWVKLDVKKSIVFPTYERVGALSKHYAMRDIFSNPNNNINIEVKSESGFVLYNGTLKYQPLPIKETLIDEEFIVDGYPEIKATFELYLLEECVEDEEYSSYMEHGIIISSGNAIHEIGTLYNDIKSHPYIKHIYGRINCSYINQLMYDFESKPDDVNNPFPIIDHSRLHGLDRSHPFTKALFRIPHNQLKLVLQDLYETDFVDEKIF